MLCVSTRSIISALRLSGLRARRAEPRLRLIVYLSVISGQRQLN